MKKIINRSFYTLLYIIEFVGMWMMSTTATATVKLDTRRLSAKDGLACNTVNDIQQDKDGFIWLATASGISRYDGYQFTNFTQLHEKNGKRSNNSIAQLISDQKHGLIWGYSPTSILCCYDLAKARFAEYTDQENAALLKNRFKSAHGMWLFANEFGARFLTYSNGEFLSADYTPQNGKLPSSHQLQIVEDAQLNVWIASDKGLNRITPDHKSHPILRGKHIITLTSDGSHIAALTIQGDAYLYTPSGKLIKQSHLPSMTGYVGKSRTSFFWQGQWYIFTQEETFAMNLKTGIFSKPNIQIANAMEKNLLKSYHFLYDKAGNAYLLGKKNGLFRKFHLLDNKAFIHGRDKSFVAAEDASGKVYICSYGNGLFVYDPREDALQHFSATDTSPLFHSNFLLNLFIDRSGCVWLCTGDGVYCCRERKDLDSKLVKVAPTTNEWDNFVRHIRHIGDGKLAVSTRANKTYIYDSRSERFQEVMQTSACVYQYAIDPQGKKWICTKGDGIYIDGVRYSKYEKIHTAPSTAFYDAAFDKLGRSWLATWGNGLLVTPQDTKEKKTRTFDQHLNDNGKIAQIHDLLLDRKGRLWICSNDGIAMVDTHERHISEKSFLRFNEDNGKLPISEIDCGIEARDGSLWFATTKGVLRCTYDEKTQELRHELYDTAKGLSDNITRSLAEDNYGNIWIGTEEGISCLNYKTHDFRSYEVGDNIPSNNFSENCGTRLPDGRLVFGVSNGLVIIRPSRTVSTPPPGMKAAITDLTINGTSIYAEENGQLLSGALNYIREISLPHDKNSLSIYFSNFDYPHIKNAMYQYRMDGIDKDWRPMTSINHADFSELSPGHYTLRIRTRLGSSQWSEETVLRIHIQQPWYNTWWAWCFYLLAACGAAWAYYRSWRRNFELNHQIELEKQMSDFRIDFFTHISHEFRTPLAIIQGAVEKISASDEGSISKNTLRTLMRGTRRLQRLINQLMEFRKVNTGNMKLGVEQGDIVGFVRNIYNDLWVIARQKEISISFTPWTNKHEMLFDPQKIESIVYNLLSNAVKYTPDKGVVCVKLQLEGEQLTFSVEDNGPGIQPERESDLFKPFMHGYASKGGMGIGLYTARRMAEQHKGSLTYQRSADLGGSLFRLALPALPSTYLPEEVVEHKALDTDSIDRQEVDKLVKEMTPEAINNVTVMVIEDDPDMMEQIKSELSVYFKVETFMDGKAGYESIQQIKPSLLICDIMLPSMSGYEIVNGMRANPDTQDIPVIMLTAFDDTNHILKAYKNFVDDYMVKPCNFKILVARALQFVSIDMKNRQKQEEENRKREENIQEPSEKSGAEKPADSASPGLLTSTLDKKFKDKLTTIVAQHLNDNSFSVDRLAELMHMGRTTMYTRTKSIMGVSPNIYIQNERLHLAAQLLLEGELNVGEVSERVGFSDATYFYKCFKAKYGVAPSKYGK